MSSVPPSSVDQRDAICALATPPGVAGLAVIRVSGRDAVHIASRHFSGMNLADVADHTIHYGWWVADDVRVDAVTATVFRAPHSYTGEDVVEVGCHGGPFVVEQILNSLSQHCRTAEPGEFTRRAFLNGKMDFTQVEAVADLIHSQTRAGAQTAARQLAGGFTKRLHELRDTLYSASGLLEVELDFSEEGYEFVSREAFMATLREGMTYAEHLADTARAAEILRSGFYCAVVGYPNAGKSSLFNALLNRPRAIVSHVPGTTRDYLEEALVIDGYTIHLYDTAGLRATEDTIELQGITLTTSLIEQSNLIMVVNDLSLGADHSRALRTELLQRFPGIPTVTVHNKVDLTSAQAPYQLGDPGETAIACSAATGEGIDGIRALLLAAVKTSSAGLSDALINARQAALLRSVVSSLKSAEAALRDHAPADLVAIDVRAAVRLLGEITGETWNPDILDAVFAKFCIGK